MKHFKCYEEFEIYVDIVVTIKGILCWIIKETSILHGLADIICDYERWS